MTRGVHVLYAFALACTCTVRCWPTGFWRISTQTSTQLVHYYPNGAEIRSANATQYLTHNLLRADSSSGHAGSHCLPYTRTCQLGFLGIQMRARVISHTSMQAEWNNTILYCAEVRKVMVYSTTWTLCWTMDWSWDWFHLTSCVFNRTLVLLPPVNVWWHALFNQTSFSKGNQKIKEWGEVKGHIHGVLPWLESLPPKASISDKLLSNMSHQAANISACEGQRCQGNTSNLSDWMNAWTQKILSWCNWPLHFCGIRKTGSETEHPRTAKDYHQRICFEMNDCGHNLLSLACVIWWYSTNIQFAIPQKLNEELI